METAENLVLVQKLDAITVFGATISLASCAALVADAASWPKRAPIASSAYDPINGTPFIALAALAGISPKFTFKLPILNFPA